MEELARADLILHAGDVVASGVLDELARLAPIEAVYGNMDEPALRTRLQQRRVIEADGLRIGMVHVPGPRIGREARLASWFPDCAAVVYGHTHVPQTELWDGVWILNPGSPTERRRAPARAMLVLDVTAGAISPQPVELGP